VSADAPVLARLQALAEVAARHAAEFHHVHLRDDPALLAEVDRILVAERSLGQASSLSACYGAWFGGLLVRKLAGRWLGLYDANAPRVALALAVVSPMDAVARRLADRDAPTLEECYVQAQDWRAPVASDMFRARNAERWDELTQDPRFTTDEVPADRAAAEERLDPWLLAEGLVGRRVLCLAAGGGRHGPLFARAGAEVTVLDLSPAQLAIDQRLAAANGLRLTCVVASCDELSAIFPAAAFDVVVQPVSSSYIRDLVPVHAGLAQVLRPGGLLVAQHKQPASLQAHAERDAAGWHLQSFQVEGLPLPPVSGHSHREAGTDEFLHTLDALIGGLCRAGFVIEDFGEPLMGDAWAPRDSAAERAAFLPPYLKLKARRR
jgi:SAM-dependent methyltransferase